jgi:hypothetical protein
MKKEYIKPEMLVHQISRMTMLQASLTGVHAKITTDQGEMVGPTYGGYVDEDQEEEFDPE